MSTINNDTTVDSYTKLLDDVEESLADMTERDAYFLIEALKNTKQYWTFPWTDKEAVDSRIKLGKFLRAFAEYKRVWENAHPLRCDGN